MISVVILTKNEEKNIADCLASVSWCDEMIVIDDNSEDKTADIAKNKGAKVFNHPLNNDFSAQRNYGLSVAKGGDWILFIDADERISPALWYEIMAVTNNPTGDITGFYIRRDDNIWGRTLKYGETKNVKILRLAKKDSGIWKDKVHEVWEIKGKTAILQNPLIHYPHQTVKEFLEEINFYTTLRAQELYKKKFQVFWWSIIVYPKLKFFINYFVRGGLFDGLPGLVFAIMMSFHSFLVRAKLWSLWRK